VTSGDVTFEPPLIAEYQPEMVVLVAALSTDCLPMILQLSRCSCVLLSAALPVIPASSAALGTDSCALQRTTGSDGRQRFAGGGEGVGEPDCAAGDAASVGLSTDERVSCRCAERLVG